MTILPIYNIIALPGAKLWLQTEIYNQFTDRTPTVGERVTLLAQKEERDWSLLDIAPTVCKCLDVEIPAQFMGKLLI